MEHHPDLKLGQCRLQLVDGHMVEAIPKAIYSLEIEKHFRQIKHPH
jgi:hypothetical protein